MRSLSAVLNHWPVPVAAMASLFLFVAAAAEQVEVPDWLKGLVEDVLPEMPDAEPEPPVVAAPVPYAPIPGRDDRTPVAYLSQVFQLGDPGLPAKLSGVGPVFWAHAGRATGALIAPDVVLTTAHLFVERGKWDGPYGLTEKPPAASDGRIYLEACGRAYDFAALELGSLSPRSNLGEDYAIAVLAQPACPEARVLPVSLGPEDIGAGGPGQVFLDVGSYRFDEVTRYATHPLFTGRTARTDGMHQLALYGVVCTPLHNQATKPVAGGSTGLIISSGCDGRPGSSGGPALLSRDGGATYSIVGVSNSYRKHDPEYNNYTRVEGAFAAHLARHAALVDLPEMDGASKRSAPLLPVTGPWLPTSRSKPEERS